jgi:uncharacterized protein
MSADQEMAAFAGRVREIMARGIPEEIGEVMDPEATVWECTDGITVPVSAVEAFHAAVASALSRFEFFDSSVIATSDGYIDRHIKRMVAKSGDEYLVPSCLVITLRNGRIFRVAEYMDSARFPPEIKGLRAAVIRQLGIATI